ncbi:replication factor A [Methanocella sp. CWC-04]|uniref:Replication factor A n=1 Tax=Methanooceanicella nereidis TaxID=2052831 RepID=A0AAP2W725_9EURY|nr:replication factor A [Methanocella sp. CWC-04]MCD1295932.1 replication factor A [Methanocella sp. CWC-04]
MVKELAKELRSRFSEMGAEVPLKEIESKLDTLINQYKVPEEEAKRTVFNQYTRDLKLQRPQTGSDSATVKIKDIIKDGMWVSLKAKVVQLWENDNKSISQIGLLGDDTGTIKFVSFTKSDLPMLEEDKSYIFKNLVTDSWQGRFSVKLNKTSSVVPTEDVEVADNDTTFTGAIVDIQDGSGLIKRCPECNRTLVKGACVDHGKQEGEYDLRVKAILDNGHIAQEIIMNQEITYKMTDIDVKTAKKMAMDAVDPGVVFDEIKRIMLGKYYTVKGPVLGSRNLIVKEMSPAKRDIDVDSIVKKVEAI